MSAAPLKQKLVPFARQSLLSSSGGGWDETRGGVPLMLGCLTPNAEENSRSSWGSWSSRGREAMCPAASEKSAKESEARRLGYRVTAMATTWPDDVVIGFDQRRETRRSLEHKRRRACICKAALRKRPAKQGPAKEREARHVAD